MDISTFIRFGVLLALLGPLPACIDVDADETTPTPTDWLVGADDSASTTLAQREAWLQAFRLRVLDKLAFCDRLTVFVIGSNSGARAPIVEEPIPCAGEALGSKVHAQEALNRAREIAATTVRRVLTDDHSDQDTDIFELVAQQLHATPGRATRVVLLTDAQADGALVRFPATRIEAPSRIAKHIIDGTRLSAGTLAGAQVEVVLDDLAPGAKPRNTHADLRLVFERVFEHAGATLVAFSPRLKSQEVPR